MTYFGFLAKFVVLPLLGLLWFNRRDAKSGKPMPPEFSALPPDKVMLAHVGAAVAYTTPWDNYLVKTRVWWYDPKLVTGIIFGYVPLEEYSFFVLQTLLTGSWMSALARHLPVNEQRPRHPLRIRIGMTFGLFVIWLGALWNLLRGPRSRNYLTLTLVWALIPIMLQTAFGGDILWQHRRLVALGIIPATLYLGATDSLAIDAGTWVINPEKTVNVHIGGKLPLEEGLFFLLTNVLITFGSTLALSQQSLNRVPKFIRPHLLRALRREPAE